MGVRKAYKFGRIIFLSLISVAIITLCTYIIIADIIVTHNFLNRLEHNNMESKIHQAQSIIDTKVQEMKKIVNDYSIWEECYNKIQEDDIDWVKRNFSGWIPKNFDIDLILVANRDKEVLDQYGILGEDSSTLLNDMYIEKVLNDKENSDIKCGFKIYNGQLYIFGVGPILKEYGEEKAQGLVIIGKRVTSQFLGELNKQFDVRMLIIYNNKTISSNEDYLEIEDQLDNIIKNIDKKSITLGESAIVANSEIMDLSSNKVGHLIVLESPRIFLESVKMVRIYSILDLCICIAIIFLLSLYLKRKIGKPISDLEKQIQQMTDNDKILLVDTLGPYEIERLANAFNNLFVKLRIKQEENLSLKNISNTDELTLLFNKRYFMQCINECVFQKDNKFKLMFCDIDFFKMVNDKYGHQIGDIVLKEIGMIIKQTIGNKGLCFRYGGEEFAVILRHWENPLNSAEEVRKAICSSSELKKVCPELNITISIGIASYPEDAYDINDLINKADLAMYYSKKSGRNQSQIFSSYMDI